MTTTCRLQELLRRPIFPTINLLQPTTSFASNDMLNPHLTQIFANNDHRVLPQQRIQCHSQSHPSTNSQLQPQPKRRYSCTQCPYSTDRRDLFRRHENIHRDEKPFRCYVCNKMFNRADHVKKHFLRIHKGLEYDVKLTKRVKGVDYDVKDSLSLVDRSYVSNNNSLANSFANGSNGVHNGVNSGHAVGNKCFSLFPSPFMYNNGINLAAISHLKEQYPVESRNNSTVARLPVDSNCSASKSVSESSTPSVDSNASVDYECEYCGCAFINYPSLHTHRYLLHRYVNDTDNCSLYRCVLCGQRSITQRAMMRHMLRHSSPTLVAPVPRKKPSERQKCSEAAKTTDMESKCVATSRRKQSQPKKIVKSVVNSFDDLYEIEKCDKICIVSKFSCKICHKHFSTYTQLIQHQMFFKHYH